MEVPTHNLPGVPDASAHIRDFWLSYEALGTAMPQDIGQDAFTTRLDLLTESVPLSRKSNRGAELRGLLAFEAGLAEHGDDALSAAHHFAVAIKNLEMPKRRTEWAQLHMESQVLQAHLMLTRTSGDERQHGLYRQLTVNKLGRLITENAFHVPSLTSYTNQKRFSVLVETAFAGLLLTIDDKGLTYVATPVSARQDRERPATDLLSAKEGIGLGQRTTCDLNLYVYQGTELTPCYCSKTQIKSNDEDERDKPENYKEDVLVLYAERDLFVDSFPELRKIGDELAQFDGTPTRGIEVAQSNIDLQLSLRDQHFQPWKVA